jgi:hypothetical protein
VHDKKSQSLTLYIKQIVSGFIFNSINVSKIFTLTYKKCARVVPQIFKKTTQFDNFSLELANRVEKFRERSANIN